MFYSSRPRTSISSSSSPLGASKSTSSILLWLGKDLALALLAPVPRCAVSALTLAVKTGLREGPSLIHQRKQGAL